MTVRARHALATGLRRLHDRVAADEPLLDGTKAPESTLDRWLGEALARAESAPPPPSRDDLIPKYAPGRSFVDVGAMWGIHGRMAFLAEESGAAAVTAVDLTEPTPEFLEHHEAVNSKVRVVRGDLHDPATLEEVGQHDVVWCTGVLYHVASPHSTLERLRSICGEILMLGTQSLPEFEGVRQACVFWPGLPPEQRTAYGRDRPGDRLGITVPFEPSQGYGNWWWGLTPSAIDSMLRVVGFEPVERIQEEFHTMVVARRSEPHV
jgi:hypothetical protein